MEKTRLQEDNAWKNPVPVKKWLTCTRVTDPAKDNETRGSSPAGQTGNVATRPDRWIIPPLWRFRGSGEPDLQ